jgi:large subunit ribosomal protein L15
VNHKVFAVVNLDDLERLFQTGDEVTPEKLIASGLISANKDGIKILGFGELTKKLKVTAHAFSKTAESAIVGKGGEITKIE